MPGCLTYEEFSIRIAAPARIPLLGLAGIGPIVTLTIAGSASART